MTPRRLAAPIAFVVATGLFAIPAPTVAHAADVTANDLREFTYFLKDQGLQATSIRRNDRRQEKARPNPIRYRIRADSAERGVGGSAFLPRDLHRSPRHEGLSRE